MNEFKLSSLRQFGSENFSFTATIRSDEKTLTEEEMNAQVEQISTLINKAFKSVCDREIYEKKILTEQSAVRLVANEELNKQLEAESKSVERMTSNGNRLSKLINK